MIHYVDSCKRIVTAGMDQKSIEMAMLFYFPFELRLFIAVTNEREISQTCPCSIVLWSMTCCLSPLFASGYNFWNVTSNKHHHSMANNFSTLYAIRLIVLCCGQSTQWNLLWCVLILSQHIDMYIAQN